MKGVEGVVGGTKNKKMTEIVERSVACLGAELWRRLMNSEKEGLIEVCEGGRRG